MDDTDRKILALLQQDGRMSVTNLAARVGLSLSASHRRVRDLEARGVIEGYRAVVSAAAVDRSFQAIVFITFARTDGETIATFERAVVELPDVIEAERLFGEPDYLLRVLSRDLEAYQELYDTVLGSLPGVQRATSTLVMKQVKSGRAVPLG